MIINDLSNFIILDEVKTNASSSEVYFLSHLLGNEMLTLPDNWQGRIYTSQFIFEILSIKKPEVQAKHFKILEPNKPIKLKSKEKTIIVTMFETGELARTVLFLFDDNKTTYLYTGIFTEVGHLYQNEDFMHCANSGIDNVYVDTTRCKGKSFIFTEDTVEEIKQISRTHPESKLCLIIPTFGYEKLLVHLARGFPGEIYFAKNQRKVLYLLGFTELMAKSYNTRIIVLLPGILSDFIESSGQQDHFITVYIIEGSPPTGASACGMYMKQWSPRPSLMDLKSLLEIVKPKNIFPIKALQLEDDHALPGCLKWFQAKTISFTSRKDANNAPTDNEDSMESFNSPSRSCDSGGKDKDEANNDQCSMASTYVFIPSATCSKIPESIPPKALHEDQKSVKVPKKASKAAVAKSSKPKAVSNKQQSHDLTKPRRFVKRCVGLEFNDSDEDE